MSVLTFAALAALPAVTVAAGSLYDTAPQPAAPMFGLSDVPALFQAAKPVVNPFSLSGSRPITSYPLGSPPLAGFTPQVVVGLTNEQNHSDTIEGFGVQSSFPGAVTLPGFGPQQFVVATLDAGSQAHIFSYAAAQGFNFASVSRDGTEVQQVQGVNGIEDFDITDAVGVYMTDFQNAQGFSGGTISVTPGSLKGHWNVPVLTANPQDTLPNIIGSPILSQWRVNIQNSQTRHITVGTTTYRSPTVALQDFSTTLPTGFSKLTLLTTDQGPPASPFYFNFNITGADNPTSPGAWTSLITRGGTGQGVSLANTGSTSSGNQFLFDTGAQLSIISQDTAASVGIFSGATPDFFVEALGVGGTEQVPGFYIDSMSLSTQAGPISWTHVPVLVLDVADPRDPSAAIPGILGMNLFNDRDLIINANVGTTAQNYVGIGPQITPQWTFNGGGTWGDDTKWSLGSPDGPDLQANFTSAITSAATISVDSSGFTVGAMKFDNANRYTITGPGTISFESFSIGNAQINVVTGSHTISAPLKFNSNVDITVTPSGGSLTLSGDMDGGTFALTKLGAGTLSAKHIRAGTFTVSAGNVSMIADTTNAGASRVTALSLAGGATPTVKLNLASNAMVIDYTGSSPLATIKSQVKSAYGTGSWTGNGITSSSAAAAAGSAHKTAIGFAEASALGSPTTFAGQTSDATSVLLRYTYSGDANLDKTVNLTDFTFLAANFNGSSKFWSQGDFNYDGTVDLTDFTLLASNFNQTLPDEAQSLGAAIPEPTSLAVIGISAAFVFRRNSRDATRRASRMSR